MYRWNRLERRVRGIVEKGQTDGRWELRRVPEGKKKRQARVGDARPASLATVDERIEKPNHVPATGGF